MTLKFLFVEMARSRRLNQLRIWMGKVKRKLFLLSYSLRMQNKTGTKDLCNNQPANTNYLSRK